MTIVELLRTCRVLPVVTPHDVETTLQLTRSLARGGMKAVEVTLRTAAAIESISAIKREIPEVLVAAGTVTNPDNLAQAIESGADFYVSPGLTENLLRAASDSGVDLVPGVATASEIMQGMDYGISSFKLFPAVAVGGMALLKSLAGPFPDMHFCPTGGLNPDNFRDFLALPNVVCVGGSWMVADELINSGNWEKIEALASDAMRI